MSRLVPTDHDGQGLQPNGSPVRFTDTESEWATDGTHASTGPAMDLDGLPGLDLDLLEALPDRVLEVAATAVDPLEVAATLEACGISNRIARDRFRQPDLFHLAQALFESTPFRLAPPKSQAPTRAAGSKSDLVRGLVFALQSLTIAAAIRGAGVHLSWWTAALALTWGWALSQGLSAAGHAMKNRGRQPGLVAAWGAITAVVVGAGLCLAGNWLLGGSWANVVVVALFALYVSAFGVLLLYEELVLATIALTPCILVSIVYFNGWPVTIPGHAVAGVMVATMGVIVIASLRHAPLRWWHRFHLSRSEWLLVARYFGTGVSSGLAISVIAVLASHESSQNALVSLVAYPVVVTLGVLEWQLRSFRARAVVAMGRTPELGQFNSLAIRIFLRSLGWYALSLVCVSAVVLGVIVSHHEHVPVALLVADNELGLVFFVGLVLAACLRIDLVLRGWATGLAVFLAVLLTAHTMALTGYGMVELITVVAISTVLANLLWTARRVVRMPFSYA